MSYHYVILGAGHQGVALAYDLALNCEAQRVTLIDVNAAACARAVERLRDLLPAHSQLFAAATGDVSRIDTIAPHLEGASVVVSAAPYRFNVDLTDAALAARASFCDLGGNTEVVRQQLARHGRAVAAGVSIVPDCGLAPGLGNTLAAHALATLDEPQEIHVRCGGLPERPVGPLGYKLVFNFDGLINEYSGVAHYLRDGQPLDVPALTELEEIEFAPPLGRCEAAATSGGTSTCPETFRGRLRAFDYKTVRHPGHFAIVRALFALGCFETRVSLPDGTHITPRDVLRRLLEQRLSFPDVPDVVVLRCTALGRHRGQTLRRQYDLLDFADPHTGFSAMQRATAFPAALVAYTLARRRVAPGARPLEVAVPPEPYLAELSRHDIRVTITESPG